MDMHQAKKRIQKELRLNKLLKKGDDVTVIDDDSTEAKISLYFLKNSNIPLNISVKKLKYNIENKIKAKKAIIPWNADMEGEQFLKSIFEGKKPEFLGHFTLDSTKYIKLLISFNSKEIEELAKCLKLEYKKRDSILEALDEYPEIRHSLLQSSKQFR